MPSTKQIMLEGIVVGLSFLILFMIIHVIDMKFRENDAMLHSSIAYQAFLSGLLGHLIFEYTGINKWYVSQYK